MHVSFLIIYFSVVRFFIYLSFRAVVSAFGLFCPVDSSALYCFIVLINKILIHSFIQRKFVTDIYNPSIYFLVFLCFYTFLVVGSVR